MDKVSELSDEMLITNLDLRVQFESENEAEIIDYIREVIFRKLWMKLGADSIFDFLTRAHFKYARGVAMRKLDAARVMQDFPRIKAWINEDEINLTQLGMFQTALRQKPASLKLQSEILDEIRHQTVENTQAILCEKLGIKIKKGTKIRIQRDGSRRVEFTFSEEEWEIIENAKDILSHPVPSGDFQKVLVYCAKFTVSKKDPAAPRRKTKSEAQGKSETSSASKNTQFTPIIGVPPRQKRQVSRRNRRIVFQTQKSCRHRHPDGSYCGSRYQLQVDHVISLWAGGTNDLENLQLLCGVHNREKFRREIGTDWPPPEYQ